MTPCLQPSKENSTRGNTCFQLFISDKVFVATYPMISQEELEMALNCFFKDIGVPVNLIVDSHQDQIFIKVTRFFDRVGTILNILV